MAGGAGMVSQSADYNSILHMTGRHWPSIQKKRLIKSLKSTQTHMHDTCIKQSRNIL